MNCLFRLAVAETTSAPTSRSITDTTGAVMVLTSTALVAHLPVVRSHLPPFGSQFASMVQAAPLVNGPVGPRGDAHTDVT